MLELIRGTTRSVVHCRVKLRATRLIRLFNTYFPSVISLIGISWLAFIWVEIGEHIIISRREALLSFLRLIERDNTIIPAAIVQFVMRAASLSFWLHVDHSLLVQDLDLIEQFRVFLLYLVSVLIYLLELLGELGKALKELLYHDNAKHQALAIPAESFNDKLQSDTL